MTFKSKSPCPVCDETYNAHLSGNVGRNVTEQIDVSTRARVCVVGPTDERDYTTIYIHSGEFGGDDE